MTMSAVASSAVAFAHGEQGAKTLLAFVCELVERDGNDERAAANDIAIMRVYAQRNEPAVENAQQDDGEDDADDIAFAAGKGNAAENDRRNHVELVADAEAGRGGAETTRGERPGETDNQAVHGKHAEHEAAHRQAGCLTRFAIAADGKNMAADGRRLEKEMGDDRKKDKDPNRSGHAEPARLPDQPKLFGHAANVIPAGQEQNQAIEHRETAQSDNDGRNFDAPDHRAVNQPDYAASENSCEERELRINPQ